MKLKLLLAGLAALALFAYAAPPTFVTKSANGNATAGAYVVFPSEPGRQIRLVSLNWNSDSNAAVANFQTGETAYYTTVTNTGSTGVTNRINRTNGLVAANLAVLEHAGVAYSASISSFSSNAAYGAFIVVASGGFGVASSVGDPVYQLSSATALPIGATTNTMQGFAIYSGNVGRPVRVQITPSAVTNKINAAVAIYE